MSEVCEKSEKRDFRGRKNSSAKSGASKNAREKKKGADGKGKDFEGNSHAEKRSSRKTKIEVFRTAEENRNSDFFTEVRTGKRKDKK